MSLEVWPASKTRSSFFSTEWARCPAHEDVRDVVLGRVEGREAIISKSRSTLWSGGEGDDGAEDAEEQVSGKWSVR